MGLQDPPKEAKRNKDNIFEVQPDVTPRREGGDDSLAESSPTDSRSDEKVIVNGERDQVLNSDPRSGSERENEL
ncbi:MAG: hypothetical protein ACM3VS_13900 [Candidatus Dadabacteria bacterium]